jgi:hypothetical protein
VRGPKHVVKRSKTPVPSEEQARRLLAGIKSQTLNPPLQGASESTKPTAADYIMA